MGARYRITHSLLSAWQWSFAKEDGFSEFLATLERKRTPPTKAMLEGIRLENLVNATLEGISPPVGHDWTEGVETLGGIVSGSVSQLWLKQQVIVSRLPITLVGVLDYLRDGIIFDCKFTDKYKPNKYCQSTQHPMYFALCPNAHTFVYLCSDGEIVNCEDYDRVNTRDIQEIIEEFFVYLEKQNLMSIYMEHWKTEF